MHRGETINCNDTNKHQENTKRTINNRFLVMQGIVYDIWMTLAHMSFNEAKVVMMMVYDGVVLWCMG